MLEKIRTSAEAEARSWISEFGRSLASGDAAAQDATLLLRGAAPDARVLVGLEGVVQAGDLHRAFITDLLGAVDLHQCIAGGSNREEQVGIGVAADCASTPGVVGIG